MVAAYPEGAAPALPWTCSLRNWGTAGPGPGAATTLYVVRDASTRVAAQSGQERAMPFLDVLW